MSIRTRIAMWLFDGKADEANEAKHKQHERELCEFQAATERRFAQLTDQLLMAQQKFELLAEVLGVVVVEDWTADPPTPSIVSVSSTAESAKEMVNYAIAADKVLGLQYRMLRAKEDFFKAGRVEYVRYGKQPTWAGSNPDPLNQEAVPLRQASGMVVVTTVGERPFSIDYESAEIDSKSLTLHYLDGGKQTFCIEQLESVDFVPLHP